MTENNRTKKLNKVSSVKNDFRLPGLLQNCLLVLQSDILLQPKFTIHQYKLCWCYWVRYSTLTTSPFNNNALHIHLSRFVTIKLIIFFLTPFVSFSYFWFSFFFLIIRSCKCSRFIFCRNHINSTRLRPVLFTHWLSCG